MNVAVKQRNARELGFISGHFTYLLYVLLFVELMHERGGASMREAEPVCLPVQSLTEAFHGLTNSDVDAVDDHDVENQLTDLRRRATADRPSPDDVIPRERAQRAQARERRLPARRDDVSAAQPGVLDDR